MTTRKKKTTDRVIAASSIVPDGDRHATGHAIVEPLFVLAIPRSFSSVVCSMLGQHPQMYALPETQFFLTDTVEGWWELTTRSQAPLTHGALRSVAQLYFGEQTETSINLARGWLRRRAHFTTAYLLEELAAKVSPSVLIDKSSIVVYRPENLQRINRMFPGARFLHLVRHPRGHGQSVMKYFLERRKSGPLPPAHWLQQLASYPSPPGKMKKPEELDPQRGWYALNVNIREFLKTVPETQKLMVRGEDLLSDPDTGLKEVAQWMGLRTDLKAIEQMKHPERSPYASFGPVGARFGNDLFFLENPALRPERAEPQSLAGPLPWRTDGHGLFAHVQQLAIEFGYR
jgi:hypothetical protein